MTGPHSNPGADALRRHTLDEQARRASRSRGPVGVLGALARLIGFLITLALIGGAAAFVLTVARHAGLLG